MKILDVPQSGSLGGVVASRNRFGQYRRTRAVPVNPNSGAQGQQRQILADLAAGWRGLTEGYRDAWRQWASEYPRTDSLGQTYTMTGLQAYVSVNSLNRLTGAGDFTGPPSPVSIPEGASFTLAFTPPTMTLAAAGCVTEGKVLLYASPPRSQGVTYNSDYRLIKVFDTDETGSITPAVSFASDYVARLGEINSTCRVFFKVVQFSAGWASNPYFLTGDYNAS